MRLSFFSAVRYPKPARPKKPPPLASTWSNICQPDRWYEADVNAEAEGSPLRSAYSRPLSSPKYFASTLTNQSSTYMRPEKERKKKAPSMQVFTRNKLNHPNWVTSCSIESVKKTGFPGEGPKSPPAVLFIQRTAWLVIKNAPICWLYFTVGYIYTSIGAAVLHGTSANVLRI